jgi:hypothetical protein
MNVTRRLVLKGALLTAASASTLMGRAIGMPSAAMVVYDSRLAQSRELLGQNSPHPVDVAHEHANFWRTLRGAAPPGRVIGLTNWSDLVQVRGLLEEKGLRLRAEARCGKLFYWEMS